MNYQPKKSSRSRRSTLVLLLGACYALAQALATSAMSAEPAIEVGQPTRIEVFPTQVKLDGAGREMRLIVTGHYADGLVQDLTHAAAYQSSSEKIVVAKHGVLSPVGNGQTEVTVSVGSQQFKAPVEVRRQETREPVSFNYGAQVVLSKQGCNSGACHGSPSGKGGFRLSLKAYDPVLDSETLVREMYNRRVNLFDAESSLLLRKPLMETPHGGGRRLKKTDAAYTILRDWIAQGCQLDPPDAPECVRLDVYPRERVLKRPAHTQQMLALAHFSDGSVRDVSGVAIFSTSDETVATVDAQGLVTSEERGEAAIIVRYLDKVETASLMFLKDVPGFAWSPPSEQNYVDRHVFEKLHRLQIPLSESCSDDEFVRRVHLDIIGQLPSIEESSRFLADSDSQKRAKLIDALLARPEYAEFWALKWGDLLRIRAAKMSNSGVHKFHRWLVDAFRRNMPYDQFAQQLLTGSGSTFANPPANYYRSATDVNDCTETTSQLFLGIRIQCAKCHNHPFERWTQDNYYGIAAFFNRVQRKPGANTDEQVIVFNRTGEVTQPRTQKQAPPWLPLSGVPVISDEADRRETFANWLVKADNPFFAKVEVNRLWSHLNGQGIVEPVDDFRDSNPPSNAPLLNALAEDFVAHGYDRRHILRVILNSQTYQLSSRKNDLNKNDTRYFSHAATRLLGAEQLLDAISQVTGVAEQFAGLPAGSRATQLPSPDKDNEFLKVFGKPARETACQCERSTDSNLSQALQMINGPLVHGKVRDPGNRLRVLEKAGKSNEEIVRELYLAGLCRLPTDGERAAATKHVEASSDRLAALEDVCWALLNSNEFLFQH